MPEPDLRYFNLNETIRVKLTDHGLAILKAQHDEFAMRHPQIRTIGEWKAPETDKDGWSKFQAWVLIRDLGAHMGMTGPNPFETTVAFEAQHLKGEEGHPFVAWHASGFPDREVIEIHEGPGKRTVMMVGSAQFRAALAELGPGMAVRRATAEQAAPWNKP